MYKQSKNPKILELTKSHTDRSINMGVLKSILIEGLRYCSWCTEGRLYHGNQKYCSSVCRRSATAWAYPQKEDGLACLLVRQDWKCKGCELDWWPTMQQVFGRQNYGRSNEKTYDFSQLSFHYFKLLKDKCEKDKRPEVDHIVPVHKGGQSIGLENHQAICYSCHKTKTAVDLSGKRKSRDPI